MEPILERSSWSESASSQQSDQVASVEDQRSAQDQGFRFSVENDFLDEDQDAVHIENI